MVYSQGWYCHGRTSRTWRNCTAIFLSFITDINIKSFSVTIVTYLYCAKYDPNSLWFSVCTLTIWLFWDWSTRSGSGGGPSLDLHGDESRDEEELVPLVLWNINFIDKEIFFSIVPHNSIVANFPQNLVMDWFVDVEIWGNLQGSKNRHWH